MSCVALVDANNFYATCETIFAPALAGRPLVVLSNNDGCIVARSAEAKALGIPMGAPIHEWRTVCADHGVVIRSSNYTLYGDMSARMLSVLQDACPRVESYSIDESFVDLDGVADPVAHARQLRDDLRRRVKISCGIGIARSKTLAKFANHLAKKQAVWDGVCQLDNLPESRLTALLASQPVNTVWGVGARLAERLAQDRIRTALDLRDADSLRIRRRYGIVLEKTVRELNGESCLALHEVEAERQMILASRSFGTVLRDLAPIRAAIAHHVSRAAEKLRAQGSLAQHVHVMLRSNPFRPQDIPFRRTTLVPLAFPSADTMLLSRAALAGLDALFQPGLNYHKCGIMLSALVPASRVQPDLFAAGDSPRRQQLMQLMDRVNRQHGRGTLHLAACDLDPRWEMRVRQRSPRYTTCWDELPVAWCD